MEKIYSLIDPITNQIRYIGFTQKKLNERLWEHITLANKGKKSYKYNWIRSLLTNHQLPIINLVHEVKTETWQYWEIHYIKKYHNLGYKLTNATDGGEGVPGRKWSDVQRIKMTGKNHFASKPIKGTHLKTNEIRKFSSANEAYKDRKSVV